MGHVKNKLTSENYDRMWCRHALQVKTGSLGDSYAMIAINRYQNGRFATCLGEACPSLVFTKKENNEWVGYCGADPNHRRL